MDRVNEIIKLLDNCNKQINLAGLFLDFQTSPHRKDVFSKYKVQLAELLEFCEVHPIIQTEEQELTFLKTYAEYRYQITDLTILLDMLIEEAKDIKKLHDTARPLWEKLNRDFAKNVLTKEECKELAKHYKLDEKN